MKLLTALNDAGRTIVVITHEDEIAQFAKEWYGYATGTLKVTRCTRPRLEPHLRSKEPAKESNSRRF